MELDRTTFKRLVGLYIVSGLGSVIAVLPQLTHGRWYDFELAFDELVVDRFGMRTLPNEAEIGLGIAALVAFAWMVASSVGLLFFRRWARTGVWASLAIFLLLNVLMFGLRPVVTSPWDQALGMVDSGLFGAILLMAYGKGAGADWFAHPAPKKV